MENFKGAFSKPLQILGIICISGFLIYFFFSRNTNKTARVSLYKSQQRFNSPQKKYSEETTQQVPPSKYIVEPDVSNSYLAKSRTNNNNFERTNYVIELNNESNKKAQNDSSSRTMIAQVLKEKLTAPVITAGGWSIFKQANDIKVKDISKGLQTRGIEKELAEKLAPSLFKSVTSSLFRKITLFVTVSGAVVSVEEIFFSDINSFQKFFIAGCVASLLVLLYSVTRRTDKKV